MQAFAEKGDDLAKRPRENRTRSSSPSVSPKTIVSDYGTKFASMAILRWSQEAQINWHFTAPGKSPQSAFIENFSGRLRESAATR